MEGRESWGLCPWEPHFVPGHSLNLSFFSSLFPSCREVSSSLLLHTPRHEVPLPQRPAAWSQVWAETSGAVSQQTFLL